MLIIASVQVKGNGLANCDILGQAEINVFKCRQACALSSIHSETVCIVALYICHIATYIIIIIIAIIVY